ncbi:hypothetical protein BGZ98_005432 [Dissophora globulifera]|nr:hypothetical protein BGZ98_005432 [Dissophora globulifera]
MVVTVLALTLCLTTVALFPVDIFLVSSIMDPSTGLRYDWATDSVIAEIQFSVKIIYYLAYGFIASFCFFWIPLAYFYFEELADDDQTTIQRLWASLKYTILFVLVACTLLLTGLLTKPARHEGVGLEWLRKLLAEISKDGAGALAFVAGIMSLAGMGVLIFYTAPGLSLLPLHLLAGSKVIPGRMYDAQAQLDSNRAQQNTILNRYRHQPLTGGQQALSERDRHRITELARQELILENRSKHMQRIRDSWFHRCSCIIRPLQFFPVDYVLIVMIILYMFWATTKGIISIGIRFFWVNLYEFRKAATQPQGLLAATMLLMLSLAGLSYSLTISVAPEYSMFGSQKYCNYTMPITGTRDCSQSLSEIIPCHVGAPSGLCLPTVTSETILKIILATPSLGIAFFYLQWLFLVAFVLALLFNVVRGCWYGFGINPLDEEEEDDLEDMEARTLLDRNTDEEDAQRRTRRRGLVRPAAEVPRTSRGYRQRHPQDQNHEQARPPAYAQGPGPSYGAVNNAHENAGRRG